MIFFATDCANSSQCAPYKHHFDECVERVTRQQEEGDGKVSEDCVEECKKFEILTQYITYTDLYFA